jgi:kynureninase
MLDSYKTHFSRFFNADPDRLHLAAHSHHPWPDVSFDAHMQAWEDAARLADRKWGRVYGEVVPAVCRHVARTLRLSSGSTVVFASNTHEFVLRLLSCLPAERPSRILTTDAEFHSFARQIRRLEEDGLVAVERVPTRPFSSFVERFAGAARRGGHDLVLFSQVFFNSGAVVRDLGAIVGAVPDDGTLIAIDGYHGFMAIPTDLSVLQKRVFYMAGGYKYAMAGEGACFLHAPPGYGPRPRNTGWFAAFGALESRPEDGVPYGTDASRFASSTFDPTGIYRFRAVMNWFAETGLTVPAAHARAHALQEAFVAGLADAGIGALAPERLVVPLDDRNRGRFLTFETTQARDLHDRLMAAGIVTDFRDDRLRFGFGIYHDLDDVPAMVERIGRALATA